MIENTPKEETKGQTAREKLMDWGYEDAIVFGAPGESEYDSALIGVTTDGNAVYDYDLMVEWLMNEYDWDEMEAIEWIDYNVIRSLPYAQSIAGSGEPPIIIYRPEGD